MIPGSKESPVDKEMRLDEAIDAPPSDEDIFPIEVERLPPKDADEAAIRYVEAVEKMSTGEFPPYYVEMVDWPQGGHGRRCKLSTHVKHPRAMLKALIVMRGILEEFELDIDHTTTAEEEDLP